MRKKIQLGLVVSAFLAVIIACSTEKNTLISRTYHGLNAHYNGYFNANELIRESVETYRASRNEDYYSLLPIDPIPGESEVIGMYPALDTAITKCKKVILNHSMPSNDRPAYKKEEHNAWIDENWTTIGIAYYYRRDYDGALKSFNYVRKFYSNDPSLFIGELWMAKTFMAQGNLTKAKIHLDNLNKALLDEEERSKGKISISLKGKKGKEDKIAKFPQKIRFDLEKTKAQLALERNEKGEAIEFLEEALEYAKKSSDEARVHFILAQLYQEQGENQKAKKHYDAVVKGNASYKMSFNARLKRSLMGGGSKTRDELKKMLRDAKNAEFKDQIYYAMAELEFKENNETKGIEYLTLSAFYSTSNNRQKAMAYEKLGDLSFSKRHYVKAQKYYDSCVSVVPDTYPNARGIRNKANNLKSLVSAVETINYEDSVQRIAALGQEDREDFLKDLIKKIKEEEEIRKKREAEKLRELQNNASLFTESGTGSKWYWNNQKTRTEGYNEFRKRWGNRENADDWRRSEKSITTIVEENDTTDLQTDDSLLVKKKDTLTIEFLSRKLPLSDSLIALSNKRLLKAHYDAGIIYKEQLNELQMARNQFESLLNRKIENEHNLLAAYQLYKLLQGVDDQEAKRHKDYILNNFPNSDYANFIRDPDYFIKKKERDELAEQEYVTVLDRYTRGLYYPVILKANEVIENEKENKFRSKYMMLKVMSLGQTMDQKDSLVPILNMIVAQYPKTDEAKRAKEMLEILANGYSKNEPYDFTDKSPFKYMDNAKYRVIVFLEPTENTNSAKTRIVDFHREFFSRDNLKVNSKIYGKDISFILIDDFETESAASQYIRIFKQTRKHLMDLQSAQIFMITNDNLKVLLQSQNLKEYEEFHEKYY